MTLFVHDTLQEEVNADMLDGKRVMGGGVNPN